MRCGVGHRCSSDPQLLWLWRRAVATAPIRPLAWEPLYATGAALEKAKRQKKKKKKKLRTPNRVKNQVTTCSQNNTQSEFLLWLSRLQTQLESMKMQVGSLASLSVLSKDLALA